MPVPPDAELVVGDDPRQPTYRVTPPFGRDLIVLVASATPLFEELRPQIDEAAVLSRDLAASLKRAQDAGAQVAATHLFVQTSPVSN